MKKHIAIMLLSMIVTHVGAQRVNRTFRDVSLSEALKSIGETSSRYEINFIYNELEDFRVTVNIHRRTVPDAVREVVGFYPMRVIVNDSLIVVECTHKTDRHVTGTIIDEDGRSVTFANVALLNPADSAMIGCGVSNGSGTFVIPSELPVVIVRISYVGYKTEYRLCKEENVGTIRLMPEAQALAGVQVKGRRRIYKTTQRGIVVNVKDTPLEKFGSVGEMIKHLPLMMADGSVAGHGIPEVYVNNKKIRNAQELDRLRAEDILTAEVITLPGTEYDAGVRSVIRMKLAKREGEGLSGELSAAYRQGKKHYGGLNTSLNYRFDNGTDIFARVSLAESVGQVDATSDDRLVASSVWDYHRSGKWINRAKYYFVDLGWNREINEHHSVGITYSGFNYIGDSESRRESNELTWRDGVLVDGGHSVISTLQKPNMSHAVNAYYVGEIGKWGLDFSADCYSAGNVMEMSGGTAGEALIGSRTSTDELLLAEKLLVKMPVPLGELSFGEEVSRVNRTSDFRQTGFSADNHIRQQTTTWSLFANYSLNVGKFALSAGLRWQNEHNGYDVNGLQNKDMAPDYSAVIPKASVSYSGKKWRHTLAFYTTRNNPPYSLLSSSVNYRSKYEYDSGNPLLKPSTAYDVSWTSSWKWLYGEIGYQYSRNSMFSFQYAYDDDNHPGVMMMDYRNIPRSRTYFLVLNASPAIGAFRINFTANLAFVYQDNAPLGITYNWNGLVSSFTLDNTLSLPKSWLVNVQGLLSPYQESGCAQTKASGAINLRVSKQFLRDKSLSIAFLANDIFRNNYKEMTAYGGINVRTRFTEYRDARRFGIDISWKFNTTGSRYKGSHAGQSERTRL